MMRLATIPHMYLPGNSRIVRIYETSVFLATYAHVCTLSDKVACCGHLTCLRSTFPRGFRYCPIGMVFSIADSRGQDHNGQRLNNIASHCFAALFVTPGMRVASIDGGREGLQNPQVSLRFLGLASDKCQRQAEQRPAAIRSGCACLGGVT